MQGPLHLNLSLLALLKAVSRNLTRLRWRACVWSSERSSAACQASCSWEADSASMSFIDVPTRYGYMRAVSGYWGAYLDSAVVTYPVQHLPVDVSWV